MTFKEYQKKTTNTYKNNGNTPNETLARLALGLCEEGGEIAGKVKKWFRADYGDRKGSKFKEEIKKEIGDTLYYLAMLSNFFHIDLEKIAKENIAKLASRKKRGKIKGKGDNR